MKLTIRFISLLIAALLLAGAIPAAAYGNVQTVLEVFPATGARLETVTLRAALKTADGLAVPCEQVEFLVYGNPVGKTYTDANGVAALAYTITEEIVIEDGETMDEYPITVMYYGTETYLDAAQSSTLKITSNTPPMLYKLTVKGSYADNAGSGFYRKGASAVINAGCPKGFVFLGWKVEGSNAVVDKPELAVNAALIMPAADVTVTAYWREGDKPCGDANGDGLVDNLDAAEILKYDAGVITGKGIARLDLADVTGDGAVDNLDAARILRYDAGLTESL